MKGGVFLIHIFCRGARLCTLFFEPFQTNRETRETNYVIQGSTLEEATGEVVAKIGLSGKIIIIPVYLC